MCFRRIGTTSDALSPKEWEIWHARFNFEGSGYKFRPVLVVSVEEDLLVIMVTGTNNKLILEHDYQIIDWREAGLNKPSIARVDRLAAIPLDYIGTAGRIGTLTARDINNLEEIIKSAYPDAY